MRNFNYDYLKDEKWDFEILNLISKITEYKGRQEMYLNQKPEILKNLVEISIIQSTQSSNKIEGIVTTDARIQELLQKKSAPINRDEEEILGYQEVLSEIHESYEYIPLDAKIILQLHRDLYKYSDKSIGGRFKNTQNFITETNSDGKKFVRFTPLDPYETPEAIDKMCQSYNVAIDEGEINPLILIPIFIHDFLCIHPFNDGNGRMSRLLTTLLLYKQGFVVGKYISIEKKIESTKNNYYSALQKSGIGWHENNEDPISFVKYILSIILSAYRDFEDRINIFDNSKFVKEDVEYVIDNMIGKFNKNEIENLLPHISKSSIEKSLKKLVDENKIEMRGKGRGTFYVKK